MKKIYLSVLAIIVFTCSLYAQVATDPSTGNVGISTTPNSSKLTVNGNTQVIGQIRADLGTNGTSLVLTGGASNFQIGHDGTPNTQVFNSSGGAIQFNNYANSSTFFHIDGNSNIGIGTITPAQKLTINGGGIGFDWNSTDKKLYSPNDGDLEWMTHNAAIVHGFAVSHQGTKIVYLNTNGNSYLNGGNVGIGTTAPTGRLEVAGLPANADASLVLNPYGSGYISKFVSYASANGQTLSLIHNAINALSIDHTGNIGVGTTTPAQKLTINGGGIGFDWNSTDKKLYSPNDGDLEWMTHNGATVHGFAVSHQGTKIVYLNINGNSYFNGGNVGIGTGSPEELLEIKSVKPVQTFHEPGIASFKIGVDNGIFKIVGMDNGFGGHTGDFSDRNNGQGFSMDNLGRIGVGTYDTKGYRFAVAGNAIAESMTVKLQANWPDYVLEKDYVLMPLPEVKTYISQNQHLPEMPSEKEVAEKGLNLGEINKLLTKKVEELTLYLISKDEEIKNIRNQQETELKAQAAINQKLLAQLTEIQNRLKLSVKQDKR